MSEKFNKGFYIALSLLIAVLFWLFVDKQGTTIPQVFRDIPVEFIGESDTLPSRNLMMEHDEDVTIDLWLSGPRTTITALDAKDIRVQVDLTDITAVGTYPRNYRVIFPDTINSGSITQDRASLSTVTVKITELYTKTVPVKVVVTGQVADGYIYMADKLAMSPAAITISGKEDDVDNITLARVHVDLEGANGTVQQQFSYELLDASGAIVDGSKLRISDKRVDITAPVYMTKEMDLTVKFKESPGSMIKNIDWEITPDKVQVAGESSSLENKLDIVLGEIDLSTLLGDTDIDLGISLPANTVNNSGINTAVLSIHFRDLETQPFSVTNISAIGLAPGLSFRKVTTSVDVILRGPEEQLAALTSDNIRIVVDLSQYTSPGTYSVPAIVLVDGGDQVGGVGTYSVACKIVS